MAAASASVADPLIVGRIGAAHGIRGWSVLRSLTDPPDNILSYTPLLIEGPNGWQALTDVEFSRSGGKLLLRLNGNTDRNVAETLRGKQLGLAVTDLPDPAPDEFYWRDLLGLQALAPDGRVLGRVVRLLDTPANDVLVIKAEEREEEVLVPFVAAFTGAVDLEVGTIVIDWPEFEPEGPADEAG